MNISQRIQAKTDNGDTIIDFLIEVMKGDLDDFNLCHRLDAARLLTKYGCSCRSAMAEHDQAIDFIIDNPREPSLSITNSGSSHDTLFDDALATKIREATDDGATVCRFLINVMEGQLKAFTPQNRIAAARELLNRGFGKHATRRRSDGGRNPEDTEQRPPLPAGEGWGEGENPAHKPIPSHTRKPSTQPTKSEQSPNQTNPSSDIDSNVTPYSDTGSDEHANLAEINKIIDDAIKESDRIVAEVVREVEELPRPSSHAQRQKRRDTSRGSRSRTVTSAATSTPTAQAG